MFCKNCGSRIDDNAITCPHCGVATNDFNMNSDVALSYNDASSTWFAVLCFFCPVIGLILYLVWCNTMPLRARSCGKGAISGLIVEVVLVILVVVAIAVMASSGVTKFEYHYSW